MVSFYFPCDCFFSLTPTTNNNPKEGTFKDLDTPELIAVKKELTIDAETTNMIKSLQEENTALKKEIRDREAQISYIQNVIDKMFSESQRMVEKVHMKVQKNITEMASAVSDDFADMLNLQLNRFHQTTDAERKQLQVSYRQAYNLPIPQIEQQQQQQQQGGGSGPVSDSDNPQKPSTSSKKP